MSGYTYKGAAVSTTLKERSLDERIQAYLDVIPGAISGEGGHSQTLKVTTALVIGFALPPDEVWRYLRLYNQRCEPPWTERELDHKIREAAANKLKLPYGWLRRGESLSPRQHADWNRQPAKPTPLTQKEKVERWISNIERKLKGWRARPVDVWGSSKIRLLGDFAGDAILLCHYLYEPSDLININCDYRFNDKSRVDIVGAGITKTADEWCQWIARNGVPQSEAGCWFRINPVLSCQGSGKGGSYLDTDIARFCFHLFEIDSIPLDLQLSLFCKIHIPIALIADSGGKSYHALVKSFAHTHVEFEAESEYLDSIYNQYGVDPKNKNASRFSRLPGVVRQIGARALVPGETGSHQRILYLSPQPDQRPIL
jgi:hypothetical protein